MVGCLGYSWIPNSHLYISLTSFFTIIRSNESALFGMIFFINSAIGTSLEGATFLADLGPDTL